MQAFGALCLTVKSISYALRSGCEGERGLVRRSRSHMLRCRRSNSCWILELLVVALLLLHLLLPDFRCVLVLSVRSSHLSCPSPSLSLYTLSLDRSQTPPTCI